MSGYILAQPSSLPHALRHTRDTMGPQGTPALRGLVRLLMEMMRMPYAPSPTHRRPLLLIKVERTSLEGPIATAEPTRVFRLIYWPRGIQTTSETCSFWALAVHFAGPAASPRPPRPYRYIARALYRPPRLCSTLLLCRTLKSIGCASPALASLFGMCNKTSPLANTVKLRHLISTYLESRRRIHMNA